MTSLNNHMAEWVRSGEKGQWRRWKERELEELEELEDLGIWGGSRRRVKEGRRWKLEGLEKSE